MPKLKATITFEREYEADPRLYDTYSPEEMAETDRQNFQEAQNEDWMVEWLLEASRTIRVEPVKE